MSQREKAPQSANGHRKRTAFDNSMADSESEHGSRKAEGRWKRMFSWCAKCCKKQRRKRTDPGKSWLRFLDCRKKKKRKGQEGTSISSSSTSTIQHRVSIGETTKRTADKKRVRTETLDGEPRKSRRSKGSKSKRKDRRDASESSRTSERSDRVARDERLTKDDVSEKDFRDFKKSCCYLCAKNTLAIEAAAASKVERADMVIQVSAHQFLRDTSTSNKNFTPGIHVRTVQSSVKVKTRETSTTNPEVTKTKRTKPKSKFKKFSLFPKAKRTKCPGVRTVACETDKSTKHNRVKCGGRHEQYCRRNN